eukprot:1319449-Amorphochlora_amoeboformis.AAC.1
MIDYLVYLRLIYVISLIRYPLGDPRSTAGSAGMRKAIHRRIIALRNTVWYRHRVAARLAVVAVAVLVVYVAAFRGSPEV